MTTKKLRPKKLEEHFPSDPTQFNPLYVGGISMQEETDLEDSDHSLPIRNNPRYRETLLKHKPLRYDEIRRLIEVGEQSDLENLDRLTKIAGGRQHARYLLSPIALYDDPLEAFRIMSSVVRSPTDLRYTSSKPINFIGQYFHGMIGLYKYRGV